MASPCSLNLAHSALVTIASNAMALAISANRFVECSSTAFGLASPLVSRKPSRLWDIAGDTKRIHEVL
jgi:hypothetical protein